MLADRYGLGVSTVSAAARDAYVQGCDLVLSPYPGATEALDRAIAADPGFALAHVGKALWLLMSANPAAAKDSLAAAKAIGAGVSPREASHIAFFDLLIAGQAEAALAAARAHLASWPRDAMVLSTTATPNGLIGSSGRVGQKQEQIALMDGLATHYGDDWWFAGHYGLALVEVGQRDAARPKIARSLAQNPNNPYSAHAQAHLCYEDGEAKAGCDFLRAWLATYPRDAFFHGHLSWHLALGELERGDGEAAFRLFADCVTPNAHSGPPRMRVTDGMSFLWRYELAGHERDPEHWRALHDFARRMLPHAGMALADMHTVLAEAVVGDEAALAARVREIEDKVLEGRYPSGPVIPALSRGFDAFRRQDFDAAIDAIAPVLDQRDRIGGSLAQTDLVEFTLLRAYLGAGRMEDAHRLRMRRRAGPATVPVAGAAALH
jgi:tetratricopeptide (TPR) repeat protein